MTKTRLVAISGVASAVALVCLLVASYLKWFAVIAGILAAVAVTVPLLIEQKNGVYSLLSWLASSILGGFLGVANIGYVVVIAAFAMPFSIFKCFAESVSERTGKPRINRIVKWIVFFLLCEVALALTSGAMYLFTPAGLEALFENKLAFLLIAAGNVAVPFYNILLNGAFDFTKSTLKKARIF